MYKFTLTFLAIIFSLSTFAQENTKQKEVGISLESLYSFGLAFKIGTPKSLWRFNTIFLNEYRTNEKADSVERMRNGVGYGVEVGKEFRKEIAQNFEIRYGVDLTFSYSYREEKNTNLFNPTNDRNYTSKIFSSGINIVFGLNYVLNEKFVIGAEILPSINYSTGTRTEYNYYSGGNIEYDLSTFSYGFNNNAARLTFAYRF